MPHAIAGLYAVTPDTDDTPALLARAEAALAGGTQLLQYRNKTAESALRLVQGRALLALCRKFRVPLIINDHLDLALELDAHLHLGAEDGQLAEARARLGSGKILGASCYRSLSTALEAQKAGADYVAFGGFFPSTVKTGMTARTPLSLLQEAKQRLSVPVVAIGGITVENAPQLIAAGADSTAVITALFSAPDVRTTARDFTALFPPRKK
jgi:thiamine-phosphate pyrophosphorylase